jgi:hypothetical protein
MQAAYRSSAAFTARVAADTGAADVGAGDVGAAGAVLVVEPGSCVVDPVFAGALGDVAVLAGGAGTVVAPVTPAADGEELVGCGTVVAVTLATPPPDVELVEVEEPPHAASATLAIAPASTEAAARVVI